MTFTVPILSDRRRHQSDRRPERAEDGAAADGGGNRGTERHRYRGERAPGFHQPREALLARPRRGGPAAAPQVGGGGGGGRCRRVELFRRDHVMFCCSM